MSSFLSLNSADFIKGLIVAVGAAVFTWLAQALNAPGFDFGSMDWGMVVKVAGIAVMSYLAKNLGTDDEGKVLGVKVS